MQVPVNILIILWLKVNRIAAKIRLPPETDGLWYSRWFDLCNACVFCLIRPA